MLTPYHLLPEDAKVWVHQADRALTQDELREISHILENFVDNWKSHQKEVAAYASIYYRRFIVFMADEHKCHVGGCSISDTITLLEELQKEFGINFLDRMNVGYKITNEMVGSFPFNQLNEMLENGKINDNTIIFNNTVSNKKDFESKWEVSLKDSPYARFVV